MAVDMTRCAICGAPYHPSTGHRHTEGTVLCGRCAWDWWRWLKARMGAMHAHIKDRVTGKRQTESFAEAAAKSIKGER